jgi:O-acetylserine/cysteine efflux transporter
MSLCCLIWGGNFVLSKWMLSDLALPPFFFAAVRFSLVAALMSPFLFPIPKHFLKLCLAALCVGAVHLAFLYTGLKTAPAGASAIVSQMMIPFATLLSVIFLYEKIGIKRGLGICGALIGVIILIYNPDSMAFDIGLIYIIIAFFIMAVGSVLIKGVGDIKPFQYLAWMGVLAVPSLGLASVLFESGQVEAARASGSGIIIGVLYTAILASIFAHGQYFRLLKTYDVSLVVPLTLMSPFWAVILGVAIRGEPFSKKLIIGSIFVLASVYIIARRQKQSLRETH